MADVLTKQELASKIWSTADSLRGKIRANEYKDYIIGFMFYKFLSDKEESFLEENDATKEDIKNADEDIIETDLKWHTALCVRITPFSNSTSMSL